MKDHHKELLKMLQVQTKVCEIDEHRQTIEEVKKDDNDELKGLEIAGEAVAAMNNVHDMDACKANDFDFNERIDMLNSDQFRVFKMVSEHLRH